MKKILFLMTASLAISAPVLADRDDEDEFPDVGFYAGVSAIHQSVNMDFFPVSRLQPTSPGVLWR